MIIKIDDGLTFEGDLQMFKNCFFSNATKGLIKEWCGKNNMTVEFFEEN